MTLQKSIVIPLVLSICLLILMIIFRHAESEMFTFLSLLLGGVLFYAVLFHLYTSDRFKHSKRYLKYQYILFGIAIPLLIFGIEKKVGRDEWLTNFFQVLLAVIVLYLIISWVIRYYLSIQNLKAQKATAELTVLKHQINPHFFFNSLNALYSMIKKDQEKAQEYVLKLSDMMRFAIYDGKKDLVTLQDEVNFLKNFLELNADRYQKEVDVQFNQQIEDASIEVIPLLFIIILENAFKHGVEKLTDQAFVKINLIQQGASISFTIKNNFDPETAQTEDGIGLKNLRDRLQISYPEKHSLTLQIEKDVYCARLDLQVK